MSSEGYLGTSNPLLTDDPGEWNQLIESMGVPSLIVLVERKMGAALRARVQPEDVLQEALLHAWRSRSSLEWRGHKPFRAWFLTIVQNRIHDLSDREGAAKRGGGRVAVLSSFDPGTRDGGNGDALPGPLVSTTPSRAALHREQAEAMREALEGLPAEVREVVRLRLFEERSMEAIADELGLGLSAVKHRYRKGAGIYERLLASAFASRSRDS